MIDEDKMLCLNYFSEETRCISAIIETIKRKVNKLQRISNFKFLNVFTKI